MEGISSLLGSGILLKLGFIFLFLIQPPVVLRSDKSPHGKGWSIELLDTVLNLRMTQGLVVVRGNCQTNTGLTSVGRRCLLP